MALLYNNSNTKVWKYNLWVLKVQTSTWKVYMLPFVWIHYHLVCELSLHDIYFILFIFKIMIYLLRYMLLYVFICHYIYLVQHVWKQTLYLTLKVTENSVTHSSDFWQLFSLSTGGVRCIQWPFLLDSPEWVMTAIPFMMSKFFMMIIGLPDIRG